MTGSGFRHDVTHFQWTVKEVKENALFLDVGTITYKGRYGLPTQGPSERAIRTAAALIDKGQTGRHVIDDSLVITIDGLEDHDSVSMLEGPGVGN